MPAWVGVTLNAACPTIGWSVRFSAEKNTSFSSPRWTLTSDCNGSKRHARPGATSVVKRTVTTRLETEAVAAATRCVAPPKPVAAQNRR